MHFWTHCDLAAAGAGLTAQYPAKQKNANAENNRIRFIGSPQNGECAQEQPGRRRCPLISAQNRSVHDGSNGCVVPQGSRAIESPWARVLAPLRCSQLGSCVAPRPAKRELFPFQPSFNNCGAVSPIRRQPDPCRWSPVAVGMLSGVIQSRSVGI